MATEEEMIVRAAIRDELSGPLDRIRREIRGTANDVDDAGKKANIGSRHFDKLAGGAARFVKTNVGRAAKAAAVGVAAMTAAAAVGGVKLLGMASDAAETASAFGTVFKGVGGDVGGYLDDLNKRFGITTQELQTAATTFGVFGKAAGVTRKDLGGFTKDLVGVGLDLSSFYNADPNEVFQALRSGLAGEAEPLRQFGIFLSDATMKAEAATMGLGEELTESQKVMVRQRIIMKSLGDAQGDMARTSDGLANKTKAIKGRFTEAGTAIGTAFLPYAEKAANALDQKLGPAVEALPGFLDKATKAGESVFAAWQAGGPDAVVSKIDTMTGAGGRLETAWDKAKGIADDLATIFTTAVVPAFNDVAAVVPGVLSPITLLDDALGLAADNADLLRYAFIAYIATITVAKAVSIAYAATMGVIKAAQVAATVATAAYTGAVNINTVAQHGNRVAQVASAVASLRNRVAMIASTVATVANRVATMASSAATRAYLVVTNALTLTNIRARAATVASTVATVANRVATVASTVASKAARVAVMSWQAAQWLLNAAMTANPIGVVIAVIAGLVAGIVIAYKKSSTFRGIVDGLWGAIKTAGSWVGKMAKKMGELFLKFTPMGGAITLVKDNFGTFKDGLSKVWDIVKKVISSFGDLIGKAKKVKDAVGGAVGKLNPFGDTATSHAHGSSRGALGSTMAAHSAATAATGASPTITNIGIGGGGEGRGSGDHQAGRALDLQGKGLAKYGAYMRSQGGFAQFHGSGSARHLHVVPPVMGDTASSRTRRRRPAIGDTPGTKVRRPARTRDEGTGGITYNVEVHVHNPSSDVDVKRAIREALADAERDRIERGVGA